MAWKAVAVAFAVSFVTVSGAQAGGLLEFLFGRRDPAPAAAAPLAEHPAVTVTKAPRKRAAKAGKPRVVIDPKEQLARTIDPLKRPDWYLIDPTLKRGDVLVLADRVVVFNGGRIGAPTSYVALARTRLISRKDRRMIARMTGPAMPALLADGAPPRQPRVLRSASVMPPLLRSAP